MFKFFKSFFSDRNRLQYLLLALILGYFLFVVGYRMGAVFMLDGDDIDKGVYSKGFIRMFLHGENCLSFRSLLMLSPYVGQVPQYLGAVFMVLFSGLFGPVISFKLTMVFIGVVSLVSIFLVLRYLCGPWVALLTVFFMGTNSIYIQSVRYGFAREEIFQIAGLWFGMCLLVRGVTGGKKVWIYFGLFMFGVTLWAKMMFAGYIIGAFCGMLVLGKSVVRSVRKFLFPSFAGAVLRIGVFCLGCSPLIIYNLIVNKSEETVGFMLRQYFQKGVYGSLKWLACNFNLRMHDSFRYCLGTLYRDDYGTNWFGAILVVCALLWCIRLVFVLPRNNSLRRFLAFVLVSYTVLLILSCFIVVGYYPEHLIIMVPFAEMLYAVFVVDICSRFKKRTAVVVLAAVVVTGWLGLNVRYEATRIANRDCLKGYLPMDFQVNDMNAIVSRMQELKVQNLCCGELLSDPVRFFLPHEMPVDCRSVDWCYDVDTDKEWYLLTRHSSLADEDAQALSRVWGAGVFLEQVEVFDIPLSCCSKLYLFRIKKP